MEAAAFTCEKVFFKKPFFRKTNPGEFTLKLITFSLASAGLIAVLLLSQFGCSDAWQEPVAEQPATSSPLPDGMLRGTVAETMNAAGYTYLLIESEENRVWAAAPETAVEVGDVVQTELGMAMHDFQSKTLNRSFDVVYFVGAVENLSAPVLTVARPDTESRGAEQRPDVAVAEFKPGQNIAYVYANKESLVGQRVSLRGTVVKYNANILGTNFIHIQDGSGSAADGNNDLTVTSKSETAVNQQVVLSGTIILDKDFGHGYQFPILMEDASISSD